MLSDVEKRNNLMLTPLIPVATLVVGVLSHVTRARTEVFFHPDLFL